MSVTFIGNWLALIPWRRAKGQHWTERARLLFPVSVMVRANLWVMPAIFSLIAILVEPEISPPWPLMAVAAALGTSVGSIPMNREVFPRIALPALVRQLLISLMMSAVSWAVFLTGLTQMPGQFNIEIIHVLACTYLLWLLWSDLVWWWLAQKMKLVAPVPERLERIVRETAARMNVPVMETWLLHTSAAQAYAQPGKKRLLFTERILEILSDEELAAVCAHELGHLTESREHRLTRQLQMLVYVPWLLLIPVVHTCQFPGFLLLVANTFALPVLTRRFSRRMEMRADSIAKSNELDTGVYARALARLHEDSLIPAVVSKEHRTHPHLYDRLIAAGINPDYPRPAPAAVNTWLGQTLILILMILAGIAVIRMSFS